MAFIDYYKIMGIPKDTPQKNIRAAYRKRVKQFHPDLHPEDPKAKAKFQALTEANDVLSDPEKRKLYDQYGEHWRAADQYGSAGPAQGGAGFDDFDFSQFSGGGGFSSFFQDLFGGGAAHMHFGSRRGFKSSRPSGEMTAQLTIDMYTALLGGEVLVSTQMGKLKLKVKPYTQEGTKVRLRGKGYDRGDGTHGDLILTYHVELPTSLSERQKQLLREMQCNP